MPHDIDAPPGDADVITGFTLLPLHAVARAVIGRPAATRMPLFACHVTSHGHV